MNPNPKLYPPVIDLWGLRWLAIYMDEGALYPRGYGIAWRIWSLSEKPERVSVACPMPMNWLVGMALSFYDGLRRGPALPYPTRKYFNLLMANEHYSQRHVVELEDQIGKLKEWLAEADREIPSCSGPVAYRIRVLKEAMGNRERKWAHLRELLMEVFEPDPSNVFGRSRAVDVETAEIVLGLRRDPNPPTRVSEAENVERQELTPPDEQNRPLTDAEEAELARMRGFQMPLDPPKSPLEETS